MRLTIIGSGNVATHMAAAFKNAGHRVMQVYSPNLHHASLLAYHVGAGATDDINNISGDTDIFIISVKDDAIAQVAEGLARHQKLIVHTSGATGIDVLLKYSDKAGVLYPLQTFSKSR
ncbi:MAG TPA: NAD(P)-binding domain-containing protein, partial [Mucilaginibacter sp.]